MPRPSKYFGPGDGVNLIFPDYVDSRSSLEIPGRRLGYPGWAFLGVLEISEEILNVQNLEKTYVGGVHAVRGVSFEVNKGESLAIIGSSGSGKSTVLRCINRLIEPTKGVIKLRGEQINTPAVDINEVRSRIGMVFQSFELFSHLRVIDNVSLGLIHVRGMNKDEANREASDVLEKVDMLDRVDAYPGNLLEVRSRELRLREHWP